MRCWLNSIAVTISGLVCLVAVFLWIASYIPQNLHIASHRGALVIASVQANDDRWLAYTRSGYDIIQMSEWGDVYQHFLGFAHVSGTNGMLGGFQVIAIPYWFIVALTAAAPITVWRRRRNLLFRNRAGVCPECGYDLRATPHRCPECGRASTQAA